MLLVAAGELHRYQPFAGSHDGADFLRILVCIAGCALVGVIGRVIIEGMRHRNMDRFQFARFLGLGIVTVSLSLGSAERFGVAPTWHISANLLGLFICWIGVAGIRREQRQEGQSRE